jgi:VIT1/CCC1 family predicted Fe2+/Mn2+ transporter
MAELTFLVAVVGGALFLLLLLISPDYKLTIAVAVVGLAVFTFVAVSQIDRLKAKQWTLWDVIIVAAIFFIMIWIYPDIRDIVLRWRRQDQDKK